MSEVVASQVAAGEVVERPASVVKELVENSLDAGAGTVEIVIARGGIALVRVVDDGHGMDRDDALLCLERHATSKIRTGADLAAIATLGFRGEAMPSIASVSRCRLATREPGALAGTEILVNGGKIETVRDCGDAPGTSVEARSLFFNLPARRKFLRSEATEAAHVEAQLHLLAIAHPAVRFVYVRDGRTVFQLPAARRLLDRIRDLAGSEAADELTPVEAGSQLGVNGLQITGFIGKAGVSRANRSSQRVFINGRAVENGVVNQALREGYHTALMKGRYPVAYLFLRMDPAAVDVNVHPAKREVRFREPGSVREALVATVRRTLEAGRADWSRSFHQPPLPEQAATAPGAPNPTVANRPLTPFVPTMTPVFRTPDFAAPDLSLAVPARSLAPPVVVNPPPTTTTHPVSVASVVPAEKDEVPTPGKKGTQVDSFKILGVLGKLYVLMENASGLVLVDQHAAHERILFEELRRRLEAQEVISQKLLLPLTLQLSPKDADWLRQNLEPLQRMGIGLEDFGAGAFKLDALPPFLASDEPLALVREIIDALQAAGTGASRLRLGEDMIAKTVCRHAVKANDVLRERELVKLLEDLLACELPYCCPHGRPTMIQMSYGELERKFGRRAP